MISWSFFFMVSNGGPKEKCWKIAKTIHCFFQHFSFGPPIGNHEKESSNFERLHEIIKEAYPESFNILSWKPRKRDTFRHPYLRILFPFIQFKANLFNLKLFQFQISWDTLHHITKTQNYTNLKRKIVCTHW